MSTFNFAGVVEDLNNIENNSSCYYSKGDIVVDKKGQLHCFIDGYFAPVYFGPRPDHVIDYLYNHN